jgi:hypothetical protein
MNGEQSSHSADPQIQALITILSPGFDRGNVFAVPVLGARGAASTVGSEGGAGQNGNAPQVKPSETIKQCYEFVQQFRQDESFIYR